MAQIPDPNQIQRRTPRASSTVATYRGDLVGNAMAQFGANVAKFAEIEGKRIDDSRVEQAYTELRQKRAELSVGEKGYATVKGDRVVYTADGQAPFTEDYRQKFDSVVEGIAGKLSPAQRERFAAEAAKESVSFQTDVMKHALKETETFHAEAKEGAINTELQLGTANWSDQNKVADSWGRINRVYDNMITVDGHAADKVNSLRVATLSKLHSAVLDQANAAGNTEYAKAYFEANKSEILNAEVVGKAITKVEDSKIDMEVGVTIADKFLANPSEMGDLERINRAIRNDPRLKGDPDRIHAAQREAANMVAARRDSLNQRDAAVDRMLIEGKTLDEVRQTPEWRALSTADQNKVINRVRKGDQEPTAAALSTFYNLKNDGVKLAAMTPDEVILFGKKNNLSQKMTVGLLELNSAYKKKPDQILEAKVDSEAFNVAYRAKVGKNPLDKGERENADKAKLYMEDRIDAAQTQLGRKLTRSEKQAFIDEAVQSVREKTWYGAKEVPLFRAELANVIVPPEKRATIAALLKKALPKGVEPSEADIQKLYLKDQQIPIGR